jgi:hypothetical protein
MKKKPDQSVATRLLVSRLRTSGLSLTRCCRSTKIVTTLAASPLPGFVHVRLGNLRLRPFIQHLTSVWPTIESFLPKHKLISVLPDRIEAIE